MPSTLHSIVDRILRPQAGPEAPPNLLVTASIFGSGLPSSTGSALGPASAGPSIAVIPKRPVKLSSGVSAGLLLGLIQPQYPAIAKAARVEGIVIVHAIISKSGRIESATAVSGPQMLQGAALEAVRSARYRPFQLNGEPTEVDTNITINFRLSA